MKSKFYQHLLMVVILLATLSYTAKAQNQSLNGKNLPGKEQNIKKINYKVTFIELGSVRCIPCQKMQVVMKSIEQKYGTQVKIVFHDVWTEAGAPYATKYGIESIPTQVFLDEKGKEFSRHVGYFPEEELIEVLKTKGVK